MWPKESLKIKLSLKHLQVCFKYLQVFLRNYLPLYNLSSNNNTL